MKPRDGLDVNWSFSPPSGLEADIASVSDESQVRIRLGWFWSVCIGLAMRAFG